MHINKWLMFNYNRQIVKYRFLKFLYASEKKNAYYLKKIKNICMKSNKNVSISFKNIVSYDPILAIWIIDGPVKMLNLIKKIVLELMKDMLCSKKSRIFITVSGLPSSDFFMNQFEIFNNNIIKMKGFVIHKSTVYSKLGFFKTICLKCLNIQQNFSLLFKKKQKMPIRCYSCKSSGPFQIERYYHITSKFHVVTIQHNQNINGVKCKQIILKKNLSKNIAIGKEFEFIGIVRYKTSFNIIEKYKIPIFSVFLEAYSTKNQSYCSKNLSFNFWEKQFITIIHKKKIFFSFLLNFLSPCIIVDRDTKLTIILTLFSGNSTNNRVFSEKKNNLNLLIITKCNLKRNCLLNSICSLLPRYILSSHDITLKELTVSLKFNELIGEWVFEAGILVLSNENYCIIKKIDQMENSLRDFFYQAVNQKKIYAIRKNKISSFNVMCSVIAFANLINVSDKTLFDLICYIPSINNSIENIFMAKISLSTYDAFYWKMNRYVTKFKKKYKKKIYDFSFYKNNPNQMLIQKLICKYITYIRCSVEPELKTNDQCCLFDFYVIMKNKIDLKKAHITIKNLECLILLIKSCAKIHLRKIINKADIQTAVYIFFKSFLCFYPIKFINTIKHKFRLLLKQNKIIFLNIITLLTDIIKNKKVNYIKKISFERFCLSIGIRFSILKKFYLSKIFLNSRYKIDLENLYIYHFKKTKVALTENLPFYN
ncbi:minichromosome maintenance component complex 2-like protein (nucleomorph) [Cryptomonas paramecium]|uniref:DNA helicase n=1 Tax=Cryptomonas paramaecium TaxID=2898 RepID=F2HHR5_9CRYP|nr:minichromosome maintenance component complex 2-like protein [Cryptomonas paramecium]AEA38861.1 minichromosome maintenance component complex 2-like protein [Cryptomonas paramecium]|mmetsp:Transcript_36629/g.96484  ORF Transcript_36629/g.96484 Transcript_36629/m.96484 type:complete len:708 (-) Transcript_36629:9691-11814(-)